MITLWKCDNSDKCYFWQLELKVDNRELVADRNLITYKLDVITADIAEMKETLEKIKGELHGLRKWMG